MKSNRPKPNLTRDKEEAKRDAHCYHSRARSTAHPGVKCMASSVPSVPRDRYMRALTTSQSLTELPTSSTKPRACAGSGKTRC